jgi:hypothetical protein
MPDGYIEPVEVARIREIDLFTYLTTCNPDELIKVSHAEYKTRTHDSLRISNGKWFWHSRGIGASSALDYLIAVHNMSFIQAAHHIKDMSPVLALTPVKLPPKVKKLDTVRLPPKAADNTAATAYLKRRGIDALIVYECIDRGFIYESLNYRKPCVVFVGKDHNGTARYAMIRNWETGWKGEAQGSQKRHSFRLQANVQNVAVHIFESPIDALSYATLLKMDHQDWQGENLLSLGGISVKKNPGEVSMIPLSLEEYLTHNPNTKTVFLHLDNDRQGKAAAEALAKTLGETHEVFVALPPEGKDVNEYLLNQLRQQERQPEKERTKR